MDATHEVRLTCCPHCGGEVTDVREHEQFVVDIPPAQPVITRYVTESSIESLDATNNQAERMLRPAVITRKTGGCNRTQGGADTHAILSSILATCKQRAIPILDFLVELQRQEDVTLPFSLPP